MYTKKFSRRTYDRQNSLCSFAYWDERVTRTTGSANFAYHTCLRQLNKASFLSHATHARPISGNQMRRRKMRRVFISLGLFLFTISLFAQTPPDTLWIKTFGGDLPDYAVTVQQTFDEGFISLSKTSSFGAGYSDIWLIKTDEEGIEQWQQTFGGTETEYAGDIKQTADGGYIIVGTTESYGSDYNKIWLIKTDEFGNELWSQLYGNFDNQGNSVIQTSDGGYIIAGATWITGNNNYFDALLIKTDANGNEEWSHTYGSTFWDEAINIQQNENNEYLICGLHGESQGWFFKTDSDGSMIWSQSFSVLDYNYIVQFIETSDQGYILIGNTYSAEGDILVIKTDVNGNEEWMQTIDGSDYDTSSSICEAVTDGYIIAGTTSNEIWLINIDEEGVEIWNQTYNNGSACTGTSIQNIDDGYIISGSFLPIGSEFMSCMLMRLNSEEVICSENIVEIEKYNLENYPNPFNPSTTIEFSIQNDSKVELSIFNIKGQKNKTLAQNEFVAGKHSIIWNGDDNNMKPVSSGIYYFKLNVNGKTEVVKKCLLLK